MDAVKRGGVGQLPGAHSCLALPVGLAPRARRAGGGRLRRARAGGAAGARGGRGCERRGPPRAGPGEERAPGWAQRRVPSSRGRPAAPGRTMATDSKCAPGRGGPGGRLRGPGVGSSPLWTPVLMPGSRTSLWGPPRPRTTRGALPITFATRQDSEAQVALEPPREGCGRRACAARRWRGRCAAAGQRAEGLPLQSLGAVPSGPGPGFGGPATKAALALGAVSSRSAWSCGLDLRSCLWE